MKLRTAGLVAMLFMTGVTVAALLIGAETTSPHTRIEDLLARIQQLELRVERLEKRPSMVAVPAPSARPYATVPPSVPRDWSPFEFNGRDYYIVPLDTTKRAARQQPAGK